MNTDLMFSSKNSKWETDPELLEKLAPAFTWDIDVCAERNNVCDNFITPKMDAFSESSQKLMRGTCWMNPPYTRGIIDWLELAINNECYNPHRETLFVCLVPARTDTVWFQSVVGRASFITFIKGRLKFGSDEYWVSHWHKKFDKGKITERELESRISHPVTKEPAPFPSALLTFGPINEDQMELMQTLGWSVDWGR